MEQVGNVLEANGFSRSGTDMEYRKTIREYDLAVCFKNATPTSTSVEMVVTEIIMNSL